MYMWGKTRRKVYESESEYQERRENDTNTSIYRSRRWLVLHALMSIRELARLPDGVCQSSSSGSSWLTTV